MRIKDYIKDKHKKDEIDIVADLQNTIAKLEVYLQGLDNGTVHANVAELQDPEQKRFAQQMILNERYSVINGLDALRHTAKTISSHKMIDTAFKNQEEKTK